MGPCIQCFLRVFRGVIALVYEYPCMLERSYIIESGFTTFPIFGAYLEICTCLPEKFQFLNNQQETFGIACFWTIRTVSDVSVGPTIGPKGDGEQSTNRKKFTKQQLIRKRDSPETARDMAHFWKDWFVGFVEGDGCFTYDNNADCLYFVIRQKESGVLFKVQRFLGFGTVYRGKDGYWTFSTRSRDHLRQIIDICNGNLLLQKYHTNIETVLTPRQFTVDDWWLCGFADRDGSFNVQLQGRGNGHRLRLRFYLDQKNRFQCLQTIQNVIGGTIYKRHGCAHMHRLIIDNFAGIAGVLRYFAVFTPQTNKLFLRYVR